MLSPQPKPESKAQDKRERSRQKLKLLQKVRAAVKVRDKGRCRVCSRREGVEVHHVKFRSLGGEHSTANCALLCPECHADIHAYRVVVTGDANKQLRIERIA